MKALRWSVSNIADILKQRQVNEFDGNIAVSGDRGNGKSTIICKIFYKLGGFKPKKHQVYSREKIIHLLKYSQFGKCMDDEAINSGYKRDFQNKGQQELIKILNAYRDNYNIYASAIPNFFSLDKDLRDLYFLHLHVIERGIAILHMPLQGRLYSQDRWDSKHNAKIEEKWSKRYQKDPNFKPAYHKLSTFRGYLFFNDLTKKQRELYKDVKKIERDKAFLTDKEKLDDKELSWIQKVYNMLMTGKLTKDGLLQACLVENKKYSVINSTLNQMLTDNGEKQTLMNYLDVTKDDTIHSKTNGEVNQLIPAI